MIRTLPFAAGLFLLGGLAPVDAELQLHWPLDASSGTLAADASGNGSDGNWEGTGGAVSWQANDGVDGGAVSFSGQNKDSFITSSFSSVDELPLTISAWVKTTSSANDAVVYLGNGNSGSQYYVLRVQGGLGRANARNTSEVSCNATTDIDDGQWHHLVGVYASPTNRRIYIDGELEGSSSGRVDEMNLNRFGIGGLTRATPHNPADLFDGSIDDVALWDREFAAEDVAALHGMTLLGSGNAGDLDAMMDAFRAEGSVELRGQNWAFASGLDGSAGETGGSVVDGNAFIVFDGSGDGMSMGGHGDLLIDSLTADHESIVAGVPVTLSWRVFNAEAVTISGVGSVDAESGSIVVSPAASTTYTLSASNADEMVSQDLDVTVSPSAVDPQISEFLAENDDGITDEDGEHSDWIEIYNGSAFTMNLEGYSLTDDPLLAVKWSFPSVILGAGERLVVWASGKDRTGDPLHADFSFDADGEFLALVRPDGNTIVQDFGPTFPVQSPDISFSSAGFHLPPTPGEANGGGALNGILMGEVTFGVPGGLFFGGTVSVTLGHDDPEATIRYTTDGTLPDESSPAYEDNPVSITETTQLRARAFRSNYLPGPPVREGYIFVDSALSSFDSDLPILVIDTFGTEIPRNDTNHRHATFAAIDPSVTTGRASLSDIPVVGGNSGIHTRGESSQLGGFNKLNFAFEVRDSEGDDRDVPLFGMPAESDWALHASEIDRTFIRERLPHHLYNAIGRYSPRTRPVEVFLNQDGGPVSASDYRGIYLVVERIRRGGDRVDIAKLNPGESAEPDVTGGYIFKMDKGDPGDVKVSTVESGSLAITYPIESKITPAQIAYLQGELRAFEAALNGSSFTDPETGYAAHIDVQSWVDFHLIQEFTKEVDSFRFSTFFFKDRNGKIECGPLWDFDRSFGNTSASDEDEPEGWRGGEFGAKGEFWARLFEDPDFTQLYIDRWQELAEGVLSEASLFSVIDAMAAEVDEAKDRNFEPAGPWPLANVTRSHLTFPTYQQHVDYMKDWVGDRLTWILSQYTEKPQFGQAPGTQQNAFNLSLSTDSGVIYYTTDGSDPRAPGGGVAGSAYGGTIPLSTTTRITARALDGGDWSGPLSGDFLFTKPAEVGDLIISEIMYHPSQSSTSEVAAGFEDEESFEFVEFMNIGASPVELGSVVVSEAFDFTFGLMELAPGARVVLVRELAAFELRYGTGSLIAGEYGDQKLNNSGERLLVTAADGHLILDQTYYDAAPWPTAADGGGSSLLLMDPRSDAPYDEASSWKSGVPSPGDQGETVPFTGGDLAAYATTHYRGDGNLFSFGIPAIAEGVGYVVEVSGELLIWQSGPSVVEYLGEWSGERHYRAVGPSGPSRYMRLRVTEN